ncbi:hypothetical protein KC221_21645 [Mycobacterium tuberculosis]|nr:hypothetical protein [Mycobacterium tuberculosis]
MVLVQPLVPTTWAQLRLLQLVVPQLVQYVAQDNKVLRMRQVPQKPQVQWLAVVKLVMPLAQRQEQLQAW